MSTPTIPRRYLLDLCQEIDFLLAHHQLFNDEGALDIVIAHVNEALARAVSATLPDAHVRPNLEEVEKAWRRLLNPQCVPTQQGDESPSLVESLRMAVGALRVLVELTPVSSHIEELLACPEDESWRPRPQDVPPDQPARQYEDLDLTNDGPDEPDAFRLGGYRVVGLGEKEMRLLERIWNNGKYREARGVHWNAVHIAVYREPGVSVGSSGAVPENARSPEKLEQLRRRTNRKVQAQTNFRFAIEILGHTHYWLHLFTKE